MMLMHTKTLSRSKRFVTSKILIFCVLLPMGDRFQYASDCEDTKNSRILLPIVVAILFLD